MLKIWIVGAAGQLGMAINQESAGPVGSGSI